MSNWDDWIYVGEYSEDKKVDTTVYNKFCLNCGQNRNIPGDRYSVSGAVENAILLPNSVGYDCPYCKFPIFTAKTFKKIYTIKKNRSY